MAILDNNAKENFIVNNLEENSLREERRRTGRYIAAGTAIFLSLLGVYQALARGTPEYAALFAPALIMFIYVFWILYASKHYKRNCLIGSDPDDEVTEVTSTSPPPPPPPPLPPALPVPSPFKNVRKQSLNRTYSIA